MAPLTQSPADVFGGRLDPDIAALLERSRGARALETLSLAEARAAADGLKRMHGPREEIAAVADVTIPTNDGYEIPARLYRPRGPREQKLPILVFAHGGGWFRCTLDQYDNPCRALANASGCMLLAIDYRLAPEHKFPVPLEDVYAAVRWAARNAESLGGDASRLAVGGDSSGGHLAAAVCLMARDRGGPAIAHQLLLYPPMNFDFRTASYDAFATGYMLTRGAMEACWAYYLSEPADGANPYASPLRAESLAGLPPATVLTAEFDPLRDEGEVYARRLQEVGVATELTRLPGMIHACVHMAGIAPAARRIIEESGGALRQAFAGRRAA